MADYHESFFDESRPWSHLKNRILGSYMTPYLAKVSKRREKIILIDAFAGPGKMADDSPGSPLIICKAAEKHAQGKYKSFFFNIKLDHHKRLEATLEKGGYPSVRPIHGDAIAELTKLISSLRDETVFLYIDPYGLDCEFDVLIPLLNRNTEYSTEILINLHMPITHRLGSRKALGSEDSDETRIISYHEKLTRAYGGEYWKDVLLSTEFDNAKDREKRLIELYREKLASTGYLNFTGACPVREKDDSQTKYFMVFASPHPDALLLLNDNMCKSFNTFMHDQAVKNTFFADSSWSDWRDPKKLQDVVVEYVDRYKGCNRKEIWQRIVQDHFMLFTSSEYKKAMKANCDSERIVCVTPIEKGGTRRTQRLNDYCVFKVPE